MRELNILICEGNTPEEGNVFTDVGIPTHTESLKESLAYFNTNPVSYTHLRAHET